MDEWEIYVTDEVRHWIDYLEIRILFAFDPWRSAILLVAGDKAGSWKQWYRQEIPRAERLLETYLKERAEEEGNK